MFTFFSLFHIGSIFKKSAPNFFSFALFFRSRNRLKIAKRKFWSRFISLSCIKMSKCLAIIQEVNSRGKVTNKLVPGWVNSILDFQKLFLCAVGRGICSFEVASFFFNYCIARHCTFLNLTAQRRRFCPTRQGAPYLVHTLSDPQPILSLVNWVSLRQNVIAFHRRFWG